MERAADWVFSHAEELDAPEESSEPAKAGKNLRDGPGSEFGLSSHVADECVSFLGG